MAKAGRGADQYMLRLPEGLRDRIKAASEANGTSINSEIVKVLEEAFPEPVPVQASISELLGLLNLLRDGREEEFHSRFSDELFQLLLKISTGEIKASVNLRSQVDAAMDGWRSRNEN